MVRYCNVKIITLRLKNKLLYTYFDEATFLLKHYFFLACFLVFALLLKECFLHSIKYYQNMNLKCMTYYVKQ